MLLEVGKQELNSLEALAVDSDPERALSFVVSLFNQSDCRFDDLLSLHGDCLVGDTVLYALQVQLLDFGLHRGVFCRVDEGSILLQSQLEPFPDLAFEIRLAAQSQGLARELFDRVEGGPVFLVPSQSERILEDIAFDKVVLLVRDGAEGQGVDPGIPLRVRQERVGAQSD